MTPSDSREQIRDTARYLRQVRPLDPAELVEYIDGVTTVEAIREELRDLAVELALIETAEGTFSPVPSTSIPPISDINPALPERYADAIEAIIQDKLGPEWATETSLSELRDTIEALKADYYQQHPVEYDEMVATAYMVYHFPSYFAVGQYVAADLTQAGLVDHHLRFLDVGAGVGSPALGFMDALPEDALVEYHAVEPSAGADILERFLDDTGPNVHPTIHRTTAEDYDPGLDWDVILFGNVLSELAEPVAVANMYLEGLAEDGTQILLAPADEATSIGLREVERALVDDLGAATVYAPTVRLWTGERPTDRGWSFIRQPPIDTPTVQAAVDDGSQTYTHTSVQYSYAYLRTDETRRYDVDLSRADAAKMGDLDDHVTSRVDVVGAKLSPDLGTEHPLFKVSDGSETRDTYAVLVHLSELTTPLQTAAYGTLLSFENVLILWNDEEGGYNLVVDDEAAVDYY